MTNKKLDRIAKEQANDHFPKYHDNLINNIKTSQHDNLELKKLIRFIIADLEVTKIRDTKSKLIAKYREKFYKICPEEEIE